MAISLIPVPATDTGAAPLDMAGADAETASAIAAVERLAATVLTPPPEALSAAGIDLTEAQAHTVLGVLPGASWESIEQARRSIVGRAHPDEVDSLTATKRKKTINDAATANAAYLILHRLRCAYAQQQSNSDSDNR